MLANTNDCFHFRTQTLALQWCALRTLKFVLVHAGGHLAKTRALFNLLLVTVGVMP